MLTIHLSDLLNDLLEDMLVANARVLMFEARAETPRLRAELTLAATACALNAESLRNTVVELRAGPHSGAYGTLVDGNGERDVRGEPSAAGGDAALVDAFQSDLSRIGERYRTTLQHPELVDRVRQPLEAQLAAIESMRQRFASLALD